MAGDADNVGFVIPLAIVHRFLDDVDRHGAYGGFPSLGCEWQRLEIASTRAWLGMDAVPGAASGVLVRRVEPTAPAAAVLRRGDVLLSFDGVAIANDGTVPLRAGERVAFSYLVSQKFAGDAARVRVLRDRRVLDVAVPLAVVDKLVPVHIAGAAPSYFVFGGCVFTPATVPLLKGEYGPRDWEFEAPVKLLDAVLHGVAAAPGQQVVLLAQVLPCEAVLGIEDVANTAVHRVNGAPVHNLAGLVAAIDGAVAAGDAWVRLELEYAQTVVLDVRASAAATAAVMAAHCIPADRSPDLVAAGAGGGGRKKKGRT